MKNLIIIFLLFLEVGLCSFANTGSSIENNREKCLNTNFQSDYTMAQCNYSAIEQYEQEIQKLLKKLKNVLSESEYLLLTDSQNKWNTFIKNDNALLANTLENKFYFEPYLISSNIKFENYKQRCQELNDFYEYLKILK